MNIKQVTAVFVIGAFASFGLTAPAVAAPPDKGGCPRGFQIMGVQEIIDDYAAEGFDDAIRSQDINDDQKLCIKFLPPAVDFFEPVTFFYQDNDFPVPVK